MKNQSIRTLIAVCAFGWSAVATAQSATDTFQRYVESGDAQNHQVLDAVLHPDFVSHYVFKGEDKVSALDRATFIKMFREKKFGGNERAITIRSTTESKNLVLVDAQLQSGELVFSGVFILERENQEWRLKEEYLIVDKRA